jgi:hypothetical protein
MGLTFEHIVAEYYENYEHAQDILEQLEEFKPLKYEGKNYTFNSFHYDGVLLDCLTEEFRQVYVGVYYLHKIKIL